MRVCLRGCVCARVVFFPILCVCVCVVCVWPVPFVFVRVVFDEQARSFVASFLNKLNNGHSSLNFPPLEVATPF